MKKSSVLGALLGVALVSHAGRAHAEPPREDDDDAWEVEENADTPRPIETRPIDRPVARPRAEEDRTPHVHHTSVEAEAGDHPRPNRNRHKRVFYGWGSMLIGYAGVGIAFAGARAMPGKGANQVFGLGVVIYSLPTTIQFLRSPKYGFLSLSMYAGMPLTGLAIGSAVKSQSKHPVSAGGEPGMLVGALVAPLVEGLALGWYTTGKDESEYLSPHSGKSLVSVMPYAAPTVGGVTVGAAGVF